MGALGAQALPDNETRLGVEVCRRKAFDPDRNIEVTGNLPMNEMELVRFFPNVSSTCHDVPAVLHLLRGTSQSRRTNVEIGEAGGLGN